MKSLLTFFLLIGSLLGQASTGVPSNAVGGGQSNHVLAMVWNQANDQTIQYNTVYCSHSPYVGREPYVPVFQSNTPATGMSYQIGAGVFYCYVTATGSNGESGPSNLIAVEVF